MKKKLETGRANYGQFPWETIIFTQKQFYVGAGVLIDQFHVMSVAHRFDRFPSYVLLLFCSHLTEILTHFFE